MANGRLVDIILVLMLVEGGLLALYHRRTGRGVGLTDLAVYMSSGVFLLLALRFALAGTGATAIVICLTGALIGHAVDLARRWR